MKNKLIFQYITIGLIISVVACKSTKMDSSRNQVESTTISEGVTTSSKSMEAASNSNLKSGTAKNETFVDSIKRGFTIKLDAYEYYYKIVDSVPSVLTEVFPEVVFLNSCRIDLHPIYHIGAFFDGQKVDPLIEFNKLYKRFYPNNDLPLETRVRALIQVYEGASKSVGLVSMQRKKLPIKFIFAYADDLNYEVKVEVDLREKTYFLYFENNQFYSILTFENGRASKDALLHIF